MANVEKSVTIVDERAEIPYASSDNCRVKIGIVAIDNRRTIKFDAVICDIAEKSLLEIDILKNNLENKNHHVKLLNNLRKVCGKYIKI